MRKGRRRVLAGLGLVLAGTIVLAASPDTPKSNGPPVRLTIEVAWSTPPGVEPPAENPASLELEMTDGRVVDAVAWPAVADGGPRRRPDGVWRLGPGRSGRVRARVEASLCAALLLRAGGQVVRVPVLSILEGPQRTATPAPLEIGVERLPWDALALSLEHGDGTVAPGALVPLSIGFNVLTPEATNVALRCTAELRPIRGGEPLWRTEQFEIVATDLPIPPVRAWNVPAPQVEGTYVLEVRSSWEPVAGRESTRLGRWIRRRRNPATATSSVRRVGLTVVATSTAPAEATAKAVAATRGEPKLEGDTIDLGRLRGNRLSASGRAPLVAIGRSAWAVPDEGLIEATGRDRLRGWITRAGPEIANLAPAGAEGLAWSALGLKVGHPGRPHRLTLTITGGHPSALGVGLVDPGGPGGRPHVLLDVCASGPPILNDGPCASFSWLVWPDATEPVLVLVNRDQAAPVELGTVTLTELSEVPAGPAIVEPATETARTLGLDLAGPDALDRFGGGGDPGPADPLATAQNLARYLAYCGATAVILPEGLADRARRQALEGQAGEDAVGSDRLDLLLRILGRRGCSAWLELDLAGPLPDLPAADSPEALTRGLVRVDRRGLADGPEYHPLHPEVREALKRRVAEALATRPSRPVPAGVLIRLGTGPTLLGGPETGLDDATYARFVRETFDAETARGVPGLETGDAGRFAARSQFVAGSARMPWLNWRSRGIAALYAELTEAARHAAPGAELVVATPGLDNGPAGREARQVDLAGLDPCLAWRAVGLDLATWPVGDRAPIVLRGVGLSHDHLAHDLATSPELDAQVLARPGRGLLLGVEDQPPLAPPPPSPSNLNARGRQGLFLTASPLAEGPTGDEPLGHALAALDARWVMVAATSVAGQEERLRRFARSFRALPAIPAASPTRERSPFGVSVRALRSGPRTYLALANDTPFPIRLETVLTAPAPATVDDLSRGLRLAPESVAGGKHLVLDLLPFGVSALRVSAPDVRVGLVTPYPSEVVLAGMQARYNELSGQLSRLNRAPAADRIGPPNPGFEPNGSRSVQLTGAGSELNPGGWRAVGGMGTTVEIDPSRPHSGRGSLRLTAATTPSAVLSEGFTPNVYSALTIQAWFRSDQPEARIRVWIEGEASGQPFVRRSELTVQADWAVQAVRASEIPAGGLDNARLRIELLTPGSLWVDDLNVSGESLSEPERLNARRALMAALHAYREKRYADFARLAGSHWARHPGVAGPVAEGSAADRADMIRTGDASALPPGRRLR